ncbi:MAG: TIGR00341 family protein, partial [Parvicellaceae bacterium]
MDEQDKIDYDPIKSEVKKVSFTQAFGSFKVFIKELISINHDVDREETIKSIKADIEFSGTNIWILMCSIIIASIGLINNSSAVIIGAMLISPLMGPIRGIGLALSTNDFKVLIKSLSNFGVMVGVSVLASFLFFLITPIKSETSEILSRTEPQVLDILIAFFGGLAGVISATIKNKGGTLTVVPGVAIATALMPPLCTVGYGLAIANWSYFIGAFYLFLLNSVFICVATFMVLRLLKFPLVQFMDPKIERKVKMYVFTVLLLIVIPSVFKFSNMIKKSIFEQNADLYVQKVIMINEKVRIVDMPKFEYDDESSKITLNISGEYVSKDRIDDWQRQLVNYDLDGTSLKINNLTQEEIDEAELLGKYLKDRDSKINSISIEKDQISSQRDNYKQQLNKINNRAKNLSKINERILLHFTKIEDLNYGQTFSNNNGSIDTI